MIFTAHPNGRVEFVNRRWVESTGYDADAALGEAWMSIIHPDDLRESAEQMRIIDAGEVIQVQETALHRQLAREAGSDASLLAAASASEFSTFGASRSHALPIHNYLTALQLHTPGLRYAFVSLLDGQVLASVGRKELNDQLRFDINNPAPTGTASSGRVVALFPVFQDNLYGYAGVILSDNQIQQDLRSSLLWDSGLRVLGLVIFILLSLVISRYILGPLGVLARAAEAIRNGQHSARATIEESTELGTVAEAFNDMAATLEKRILPLEFLAAAGAVLPNTFRETGDIDKVLRQFCDRLAS